MKKYVLVITVSMLVFISLGCIDSSNDIKTQISSITSDIVNKSDKTIQQFSQPRLHANIHNVGDAAITSDNIKITVEDVKLSQEASMFTPPDGAIYLCVKINVTNVGKQKTSGRILQIDPDMSGPGFNMGKSYGDITLLYDNLEMPMIYYSRCVSPPKYGNIDHWERYDNSWYDFNSVYPGISKIGWVAFEVPSNINFNETKLILHKTEWRVNLND